MRLARSWISAGPLFLTWLACAPFLLGCSCVTSLSICDEVKASNAVFIGTVESIADTKTLLQSARTPEELRALLEKYLFQEDQVTLRIKMVFRQADDDSQGDANDDKDDDDDKDGEKKLKAGDSVVVWTEAGDCGFEFKPGETYLVYAVQDEGNGRWETTRCTRTARVTDAGEDLAYLFFYQNGGQESARLEGFATSELRQVNRDRFHYSPSIGSPVSDVTVELRSSHFTRFVSPDIHGRFLFDGLAEGVYTLFAYGENDPAKQSPLTSSIPLRIKPRSCNSNVLFIPPAFRKK